MPLTLRSVTTLLTSAVRAALIMMTMARHTIMERILPSTWEAPINSTVVATKTNKRAQMILDNNKCQRATLTGQGGNKKIPAQGLATTV